MVAAERREALWRRYTAGGTIPGIAGALGQEQTSIHRRLLAAERPPRVVKLQGFSVLANARRSRASRPQVTSFVPSPRP